MPVPARLAGLEFPPGLQEQPLKSHVGMSNHCSPEMGVVNKNSLFVGRLGGGLGTQSFLQKLVSSHIRLVSQGWDPENGPLGFSGLIASGPPYRP